MSARALLLTPRHITRNCLDAQSSGQQAMQSQQQPSQHTTALSTQQLVRQARMARAHPPKCQMEVGNAEMVSIRASQKAHRRAVMIMERALNLSSQHQGLLLRQANKASIMSCLMALTSAMTLLTMALRLCGQRSHGKGLLPFDVAHHSHCIARQRTSMQHSESNTHASTSKLSHQTEGTAAP